MSKISVMPLAGPLQPTDEIPVVQNGNKHTTPAAIRNFVIPAGGATGQALKKTSNTDYEYGWGADEQGTGGGGSTDGLRITDAPFNAVGNGTTDDTAAIQACINAAESQNKKIIIPKGVFLCSNLNLGTQASTVAKSFEGQGYDSILKTTGNAPIISPNSHNYSFQGIRFKGDYAGGSVTSTKPNQHGIFASGWDKFIIRNCWFENLGGSGLKVENVSTTTGGLVEGCYYFSCRTGFETGLNGQYIRHTSGIFYDCKTGIYLYGPNNSFVNCSVGYCETGVHIQGSSNNHGKMQFVGGAINHNDTAVKVFDTTLGSSFVGTHILVNNTVYLKNSELTTFEACNIGGNNTAFYLENSGGAVIGGKAYPAPPLFYHNYNNTTSHFYVSGLMNTDGSMGEVVINGIRDAAIANNGFEKNYLNGPTYVNGRMRIAGVQAYADNAAASQNQGPGILYYRTGHGLDITV